MHLKSKLSHEYTIHPQLLQCKGVRGACVLCSVLLAVLPCAPTKTSVSAQRCEIRRKGAQAWECSRGDHQTRLGKGSW